MGRAAKRFDDYHVGVIHRWTLTALASLAATTTLAAQLPAPRSVPATQPALAVPLAIQRPLVDLVRDLDSTDQRIRESARMQLMLLGASDLEQLLTAARSARPLSNMQLSNLREVVIHVFLTRDHNFSGAGRGFMGIQMGSFANDEQSLRLPAVVVGRTTGYDASRVLRDGDTIVGMQNLSRDSKSMSVITNYADLQGFLRDARVGEWILIRVIRNGEAVETGLHLAPRPPEGVGSVENPNYVVAEFYWRDKFAARLNDPASRPAS